MDSIPVPARSLTRPALKSRTIARAAAVGSSPSYSANDHSSNPHSNLSFSSPVSPSSLPAPPQPITLPACSKDVVFVDRDRTPHRSKQGFTPTSKVGDKRFWGPVDVGVNFSLTELSENTTALKQKKFVHIKAELERCHAQLVRDHVMSIFDYDDTVIPTTWLLREGLISHEGAFKDPDEAQRSSLEELSDGVLRSLEAAAEFGRVCLVTNGSDWWIPLGLRRYLPELQDFFRTRAAMSALSLFGHTSTSTTEWKVNAFGLLLTKHLKILERNVGFFMTLLSDFKRLCRELRAPVVDFNLPTAFTLLSIGDSEVDRDAAVKVSKAFTETGISVDCRTLLLQHRPTITSMVSQHQKITNILMKRNYSIKGQLNLPFKHGEVDQL